MRHRRCEFQGSADSLGDDRLHGPCIEAVGAAGDASRCIEFGNRDLQLLWYTESTDILCGTAELACFTRPTTHVTGK